MAAAIGFLLTLLGTQEPALADAPRPLSDLDGIYIALGPLGSAVHTDAGWNGGFGGEISLVRVTERRPVAGLAFALGGLRFSDRKAGHLWSDLSVATRWPFGVAVGLSAGPTIEVDEVLPPRFGGHGTLWIFAGVIPYARIGAIDRSGVFAEFGVRIALPAIRL